MGMFGKYVKNINKQVGTTLTSEKAKAIRKCLITFGIIVVIIGIVLFIVGVGKMFGGIFDSPKEPVCPEMGEPGWFECESESNHSSFADNAANMILGFSLGAVGMIVGVIGVAMIQAGLAVLITGAGSVLINNAIENAEEEHRKENPKETKRCNNCGGTLEFLKGKWRCPYCGDDL